MNIKDAKPWQSCHVKAQILGVMGGGLVVKFPGGHRMLIKQEHLDSVTLVEEEKTEKAKKESKKND